MEMLEGLFQYSTSPIMAQERIQQQIKQANNMANEIDMPSNIIVLDKILKKPLAVKVLD